MTTTYTASSLHEALTDVGAAQYSDDMVPYRWARHAKVLRQAFLDGGSLVKLVEYLANYTMSTKLWDSRNDYIVEIRPSDEPSYRGMPVGPTLSQRDAKVVADWLRRSINELIRLIESAD